jgi:hypothetical protein
LAGHVRVQQASADDQFQGRAHDKSLLNDLKQRANYENCSLADFARLEGNVFDFGPAYGPRLNLVFANPARRNTEFNVNSFNVPGSSASRRNG